MIVYVTKYALTKGIQMHEVGEPSGSTELVTDVRGWQYGEFHGQGREWHKTLESARIRAEELREAKIVSLQKQIKKLKNLRFEGDPS